MDSFKNFAIVQISGTHASSDVNIQVTDVNKLPSPHFNGVVWDSAIYGNPSDDPSVEILRITGVDSSLHQIIVSRAQEGTSAATLDNSTGDYKILAGITKKIMDEIAYTGDLNDLSGDFLNTGSNLESDNLQSGENIFKATRGIYRSFSVPAGAIVPDFSSGPETGILEIEGTGYSLDALIFDEVVEELGHFSISMPDDADLTQPLKAKIYWKPQENNGGGVGVSWRLNWSFLSDDSAFANITDNSITIRDTLITSGHFHITSGSPEINLTGVSNDDYLTFDISRKVADSFDNTSGDIALVNIKFQYKEKQIESTQW